MIAYECKLDDCGHIERSLTPGVLALKLEIHLEDEHGKSLDWLVENDEKMQEWMEEET